MAYGGGYLYYSKRVESLESQASEHLREAERVLAAIPIWHKKIKTDQIIKIGIITDTHVRPTRIDKMDKSEQAPRQLDQDELRPLQNFVAQMKEAQPDFIVHVGDIIEGTNDPEHIGMMGLQLVREELLKATVPIKWILGNHELRSVTKEQFLQSVQQEKLDFVFDRGDYRFIFLDGNHSFVFNVTDEDGEESVFGNIPEETVLWLKEQLATDKRTYIFCHYPMTTQPIVSADNEPKKAIANVSNLQDILNEYRVEAVFSGHVEARDLIKDKYTSHYLLTGTKKSKKFPESYYTLTIDGGAPNVDMYFMPPGNDVPTNIAFGDEVKDVVQSAAETKIDQMPIGKNNQKNENGDDITKKRIEIIKTPAKEGSGLEWHGNKWISIDDSGYIFAGEKKVHDSKNDLEGIALCNENFYIAVERSDEILILNKDFQQSGSIPFKIGGGNTGAEGIACSKNGLYITEQGGNTVYEIDNNGKIIDTIKVTHNDLSGADFYNGQLYVLSDEDDVVMIVDGKSVVDEIRLDESREWEGIKVVDDVIYIIEDDES